MIHEIHPHQFNNQFYPGKKTEEEDYIFHYQGNMMLMKKTDDGFMVPQKKDLSQMNLDTTFSYLFSINNQSCFLLKEDLAVDPEKFVYQEISFFRTHKQKEIAWISLVGFQLMSWYELNKFCGKCGSETYEKSDERAIVCPVCDTQVYPKISPAIIVAIVCGNSILLARNSNFPESWYSLVAGYADIGESLEETVIREVKEEVGIDIRNLRYYKSQPWPFSGSMMIGFIAKTEKRQQIQIDKKEITDAAWFERNNLPNHPSNISIAGEMIELFLRGEI